MLKESRQLILTVTDQRIFDQITTILSVMQLTELQSEGPYDPPLHWLVFAQLADSDTRSAAEVAEQLNTSYGKENGLVADLNIFYK